MPMGNFCGNQRVQKPGRARFTASPGGRSEIHPLPLLFLLSLFRLTTLTLLLVKRLAWSRAKQITNLLSLRGLQYTRSCSNAGQMSQRFSMTQVDEEVLRTVGARMRICAFLHARLGVVLEFAGWARGHWVACDLITKAPASPSVVGHCEVRGSLPRCFAVPTLTFA